MAGPLTGIRVLEVADYVFVPSAGGLLAEWGADVIKVEHRETGDAIRGLHGGPGVSGNVNLLYEVANRGKRSIGLDLMHPSGLEVLDQLVATSDVFLTNKLPRVRAALGIDIERLRNINSRLVYGLGTGTGMKGEGAERGSFDLLAFWFRTGSATNLIEGGGRPPYMPAAGYGDLMSGLTLAGGVALALLDRERTGQAGTVETSLLSAGLWGQGVTAAKSQLEAEPFTRPRHHSPEFSTNPLLGSFRTRDGRWIALSCLQGFKYWREACELLGRPDLIADERFSTASALFQNAIQGALIIADLISAQDLGYWIDHLATFSGQWAVVQDSLEVGSDPDVEANGYLVDSVSSDDGIPIRVVGSPIRISGREGEVGPAPRFNEHCEEVLTELGLDEKAIMDLKLLGCVS